MFESSRIGKLLLWLLVSSAALFVPASAFAAPFSTSGIGTWNGFNAHINVIECRNLTHIPAQGTLNLYDFTGASVGKEEFSVSAFSVNHLILNSFPIANSYGTFSIQLFPSVLGETSLACDTFMYRSSDGELEYVTSVPVNDSHAGITGGIFNTANPSAESLEVFNWLTVYNVSDKDFSATVKIYSLDGWIQDDQTFRISLPAKGRRDFSLGTKQTVGLYRIVPDDDAGRYGAFISRYGEAQNGKFRFALSIPATAGNSGTGLFSLTSENPDYSWLEVGNPSSSSVEFRVDIVNQSGEVLAQESATLSARAQTHLPVHELIKGLKEAAYLRVTSDQAIVANNVLYAMSSKDSNVLNWAIALPEIFASTSAHSEALPFNTYLDSANELSLVGTSSDITSAATNLLPSGDVVSIQSQTLSSDQPIAVETIVGQDRVGQAVVDLPSNFGALMTRHYRGADGGAEYVIALTGNNLSADGSANGGAGDGNGGSGDDTDPPPPDVFVEDTCFPNSNFSLNDLATGVVCTQTSPTDATTYYFQHLQGNCGYRRELILSGPFGAGKKVVQIQNFAEGSDTGETFTYSDFMGPAMCQTFEFTPMGPTQSTLASLITLSTDTSNPLIVTSCHIASTTSQFDTAPFEALCQ